MEQNNMKPRGKRNAFIFFTMNCRLEHKKFYPNEKIQFADFGKKCSQRWKEMSSAEKQRYIEMAEADKKRHESEKKYYVPSKGRGKFRSRDPNAPKRPLCGFFWFCRCERNRVKLMYPGSRVADVTKMLARLWTDAGQDVKQKYEQMAIQDKARYEMEMTMYKKNPAALSQYQTQNYGMPMSKGTPKCL